MMSLKTTKTRELIRQLKLGLIFYKLYHIPKGFIKKIFRQGVTNMFLDWQGQLEMEKAVDLLQPLQISQGVTKTLDNLSCYP